MSGLRASVPVALALVLAGCDRPAEPDRADAGGQILEGSIGDAMLPLDTVRSQPPLAGPTGTASDRPGVAGADPMTSADDAASEDEAGDGVDGTSAPAEVPVTTPDAAPPTP